MNIKEKIEEVLESKKESRMYIDEVRKLLPELQGFMSCILEAQDPENDKLILYLLDIVKNTVLGIENMDEILLRDVLEFGWLSLVNDVMGETESDDV